MKEKTGKKRAQEIVVRQNLKADDLHKHAMNIFLKQVTYLRVY